MQKRKVEKENVCFEEARRESIKENEKKAVDMSQETTRYPAVTSTHRSPHESRTVRTCACS